jgi:galactose mutarotase-like enzyme
MTQVYGLPLADARRRVGSFDQIARIDSFVESEGESRGARRLRVINGSGIEIDLHPDRSLDLGQVSLDGIPIAWMRAAGISAPAFYNPAGSEWLRTFGGGFLTTCGLDTFGPPSNDQGREFGQHGRISASPARMITTSSENSAVVVEGLMRQSSLHGENLTLRRRVSSAVGSDTFQVDDVVTNEGSAEAPHMILYHVNLGWPLVEEGAALTIPSANVEPRDRVAAKGLESRNEIMPPAAGNEEQVFLHTFDRHGRGEVSLDNHRVGVGLTMRFDLAQLPLMYQWNMFTDGSYVLGLEPANCRGVLGRAQTRADGNLPILQPGESVSYRIEFQLRRLNGRA